MKRPLLVRGLWALAGLAALLLALRTFVGDVYHVDSGSMEPTLWVSEDGGEWVFVRYDRSAASTSGMKKGRGPRVPARAP